MMKYLQKVKEITSGLTNLSIIQVLREREYKGRCIIQVDFTIISGFWGQHIDKNIDDPKRWSSQSTEYRGRGLLDVQDCGAQKN